MPPYHSKLARQLTEVGLDAADPSPALAALLARVSDAYAASDSQSETLMTVLDTISDTTCHVDRHGILRGISDRGRELLRIEPAELLDKPLLEQLYVEDEDGKRLTTADLARDRRIEEGLLVRRDGSRAVVAVSISCIAEGRGDGAVVMLRDLEDRLAREEDLHRARIEALAARKAERAKSLFLANMSHELRTPLNAIIGYSEILADEVSDRVDAEHRADLERIRAAGRHLSHLIGGILDLAKIEADRLELAIEPCDAVAIAQEALDTVRPDARHLELGLDVSGSPPAVRADPTRLRQCLYNLLSNAVKFTREGRVTVRIAAGDDAVRIAVLDTGPGIAPDALPRLFTEFEQADPDVQRRYGGTGLGLALSRRLCRLMGGDLQADSRPGVGSTFTITLPIEDAAADATEVPATPRVTWGRV